MLIFSLTAIIFLLGIIFTYTNGISAVAASALSSHSIKKPNLIILIFLFELTGTMLGGSAVAGLIQSISGWPEEPTLLPLLASALLSAISWNFLSSRFQMPASSTHALLGGMIGALAAGSRSFENIRVGEFALLHPTGLIGAAVSLILSPLLGFAVSYVLFSLLVLILLRASIGVNHWLKRGQWFTTAALAFGHGQNDTQKTMGLLVLALNAAGYLNGHDIPVWVRACIGLAMGLSAFSLSEGVVKELAFNLYKLRPMHALAAEASGAAVLISNSVVGGPVSAAQLISATLMGAGTAERKVGIHWLSIKEISLSWLITIPANAILAAIIQLVLFEWLMPGLKK